MGALYFFESSKDLLGELRLAPTGTACRPQSEVVLFLPGHSGTTASPSLLRSGSVGESRRGAGGNAAKALARAKDHE